ncbi:hypothetical protein Nm8I071_20470 [Nonomuraea sp. TT08I-71]|nr:hypothetical protein Nm8I071_20470 [Nonomuraea sp. TT08I-71]
MAHFEQDGLCQISMPDMVARPLWNPTGPVDPPGRDVRYAHRATAAHPREGLTPTPVLIKRFASASGRDATIAISARSAVRILGTCRSV